MSPLSETSTGNRVNLCEGETTINENERNVMDEVDAEERLARSRERNREHARRTRLRKKAQLRILQDRARELQNENSNLKQSIEECSIANILLGLSSNVCPESIPQLSLSSESTPTPPVIFGKRKRAVSDADSDSTARKAAMASIPGLSNKNHINWKTGYYTDTDGNQKQLTPSELENLRRERNRMHAKMTRDRKKVFIASIDQTISLLEAENRRMREVLSKCAASSPTLAASVSILKSASTKPKESEKSFYRSKVTPSVPIVSGESTPVSGPVKAPSFLRSGAFSSALLDDNKFSLTASALVSHVRKSTSASCKGAPTAENSCSSSSSSGSVATVESDQLP
uniref:BZIP domain-containing protein n=1 Tax=Corethron hystrix TaxID=216773 RepID=A0A6U5IV75_9STRA|mmetsp:Transcript_34884/g.80665  ORF Transcript_34884/g.80665 Transcript_34884/m.80665 type:complete len:342 (+) Transcript_34884:63-1088(+)|eukprot:CAMPEP_0113308402 /NCGR_PEP_ID=MMETSP0010_2-20120614/6855_1 /TAXON_ID=216773 ORGANISM="Corethron hystrix, Strain 308" /NCGR_SAMPLE_ID=MMETSP0010_2 /ASSEMBLY_ACC=CAM_ASM_000155 /LENGTH=341 /DNA_ID=CAMNT_0000163437 /DNA_START=56 /DNA_END=1081 /DNA_ORIENTATION=+ /assembly_acc=CAM_ASM_000155